MSTQLLWACAITVLLGIVLGSIRYFFYKKPQKERENAGQELLRKIATHEYTKSTMPNNYPEYPGELENTDAQEYLEFVDSGILNYIK